MFISFIPLYLTEPIFILPFYKAPLELREALHYIIIIIIIIIVVVSIIIIIIIVAIIIIIIIIITIIIIISCFINIERKSNDRLKTTSDIKENCFTKTKDESVNALLSISEQWVVRQHLQKLSTLSNFDTL